MIFREVVACQVQPEPFEDHLSTHGHMKAPRNMPQEKQTEQLNQ